MFNFFNKKPRPILVQDVELFTFVKQYMGENHFKFLESNRGKKLNDKENYIYQSIEMVAWAGILIRGSFSGEQSFAIFWRTHVYNYFVKAYTTCLLGNLEPGALQIIMIDFYSSCRDLLSLQKGFSDDNFNMIFSVMNSLYIDEGGFIFNPPVTKILQKHTFTNIDGSAATKFVIRQLLAQTQITTCQATSQISSFVKTNRELAELSLNDFSSANDDYLFFAIQFYFLGSCIFYMKSLAKNDNQNKRIRAFEEFINEAFQGLPNIVFSYMQKALESDGPESSISVFLLHLGKEHTLFKYFRNLEAKLEEGFQYKLAHNVSSELMMITILGRDIKSMALEGA